MRVHIAPDQVRSIRTRLGETQEQFGRRFGRSKSQAWRWEQRGATVFKSTALRWQQALKDASARAAAE